MKKKTLPIGSDDFREIRESNKYFSDKSMMIQEFLNDGNKATLITRPRRFGKTLNMTMLRDFLDITQDSYYDAKENAYHMLFLGMCLSLDRYYKISSNIEAGLGRCDIIMESKSPDRPHIIIEFKEGEDTAAFKVNS